MMSYGTGNQKEFKSLDIWKYGWAGGVWVTRVGNTTRRSGACGMADFDSGNLGRDRQISTT